MYNPRKKLRPWSSCFPFFIWLSFAEEGSSGLQRFLYFMTGLSKIPPLGLEKNIDIEFDMSSKLFFAKTCGSVLRVPASHQNFETFYEKILKACDHNSGFGSV